MSPDALVACLMAVTKYLTKIDFHFDACMRGRVPSWQESTQPQFNG